MDTNHQSLADESQPPLSTPRRRSRNKERVRVTRACDGCKRRKIKCNGTQPCDFCLRTKARCTFNSSYARGRVPTIPSLAEHEAVDQSETPSTSELQEEPLEASTMLEVERQASPQEPQEDLQGHYIGPASGVSFLLRVQKRLHQSISFSMPSSIFTFGDAPLQPPEFDPSFCMVLPREDAQRLFDRYFDFAMPTYRFLHRPTLQEWFVEFYDTLGTMRDGNSSACAKIALLFMIFAHARVYMPENDRPGPSDLSSRYFLAAEHQLSKESGSIRLTSVQARLLQCYYLLTQSRVNHCWSQFGTVTNLALALGLNRNKVPGASSGLNHIEVESRRRTFWCAYTLDAYLSVSLGRPRSLHDDDIDVELPWCVDDHEITRDEVNTAAFSRGYSIMLAPVAHMKLARIISRILKSLYSIKPISNARRAEETQQISAELQEWRAELSRFLDAEFFSTSLIVPIYQRQRNVLNLTYWHAIILTHRQSLLNNFAQISQQGASIQNEDVQNKDSVGQCLKAALDTMKTIDDITRSGQMFHAFWITAYFAFTAAMVLYIYVIQEWASPPDTYSHCFAAATRCQSHMATIAQKGSLLERYCLVLEELRVESIRQIKRLHPTLNLEGFEGVSRVDGFDLSMAMDPSPSNMTNYAGAMGDGGGIDFNGMPLNTLNSIEGFQGWGQFASMVTSGLGNLDIFHQDDTFGL